MSHQDLTFDITPPVRVAVDFHKRRATASCKTNDGKSIHLNADFETLEKLREEIRKRLLAPTISSDGRPRSATAKQTMGDKNERCEYR